MWCVCMVCVWRVCTHSSLTRQTSLHSHHLHHSGRCPGCSDRTHTGTLPRCRWLSARQTLLTHTQIHTHVVSGADQRRQSPPPSCTGTHDSVLRLSRPCSRCLRHSTSAQRCSCRPYSGTPYLNTSSCLHTHTHTLTMLRQTVYVLVCV